MSCPLSRWVGPVADDLVRKPAHTVFLVHVLIVQFDFCCTCWNFLLAVRNSCPCLSAITDDVKFIYLFNLSFLSFPDEHLLGHMSSCRAWQNQPSTFSMCMITVAMHAVVIETELYISYDNFKALHAACNASLNDLSRNEWECDWVS